MNARLLSITDEDINLPHLHKDAEQNIPKELQNIPQWISWVYGPIDATTGKRRKLPIGKDGTGSAWQIAHQWMGFDEAIGKAQSRGHCGIGLVLPAMVFKGEHLVATDHDKVGLVEPDPVKNKRLAEIEVHFKSLGKPYIERTPSGDGFRMLVTSKEPLAQISSSSNPLGGADELFCTSNKWITVTGDKMAGGGVPEATTAIGKIADHWRKRADAAKAAKTPFKASVTEDVGQGSTSVTDAPDEALPGSPPRPLCDESSAPALAGLIGDGFVLPAKVNDGEGREFVLLQYAGFLRSKGLDQATIERKLLVYNRSAISPPHTEEVVLDRARRFEGQMPMIVAAGVAVNASATEIPPRFSLTDTGNAERLGANMGNHIAWVHEHNTWIEFANGGWHERTHAEMVELATIVMKQIYAEAASASNPVAAKHIATHAGKSLSNAALGNAIQLLKAQPGVQIRAGQLDAEDMVIGSANGVLIDLRTGQARNQEAADYITKALGCAYDPIATCPTWETFLKSVFCGLEGATSADDDQGMIAYLQKAVGYILTGRITEKQFFFLHGFGNNGKSVFSGSVKELMGSYGVQSQPEAFMLKPNGGGATPELARLKGARVVIATETEDGQHLAEGVVKQLTGGDMVAARELYGKIFEFSPKFKLMMVGNHKPVIRGDDTAIWTRVHLVPFTRTFELHQQDTTLPNKLRQELPGILNWAIRGCLLWQKDGRLFMPDRIQREVQSYKSDMDLIQQWLDDCCTTGSTLTEASASAYHSFGNWAKNNGNRPFTQTRFSRKLTERGFSKTHTRGGKVWTGFECRQVLLAGLI